MKHLLSKDLGLIFLLTVIYIILISFPYLPFNKSFLEFGFFVIFFLFAGYSLISLLRPEEDYHDIFKKPVLILEFSVLIMLTVSVLLKFSSLGLHLMTLDNVMAVIIMIFSMSAYIRRIGYKKTNRKTPTSRLETPIQHEELTIPTEEKSIPKNEKLSTEPSLKFKFGLIYDLILVDLLSIFAISTFFIIHLNINLVHNILGIVYMVFIPGYVLMVVILPKKGSLGIITRLGLSLGVSLPVTSLIGIAMYYTKYGINTNSLLIPLAILTILLSIYAIKRRI